MESTDGDIPIVRVFSLSDRLAYTTLGDNNDNFNFSNSSNDPSYQDGTMVLSA